MDEPWEDFQEQDTNPMPWQDFGGGTTVAEVPSEPPPLTIPKEVTGSFEGIPTGKIKEMSDVERPKSLWETANTPLVKTFTGKSLSENLRDTGEQLGTALGGESRTLTPEERATEEAGDSKAVKAVRGAAEGGTDLVDSLVSPLGIATLGIGVLPKLAQRAVAGSFAAQMLSQTPEQARELKKAIDEGDTAKAARMAVGLVGGTAMGALGAKHAIIPEGLTVGRITPKPFTTPEALQPLADRINSNVPRGTSEPATIPPGLEEAAKVLPRAAAEVAKIQPTEVSDATQKGKVEGNVPGERTGDDARGTPAEAGVGGGVPAAGGETAPTGAPSAPVRPASEEVLTPAVRHEGKIYEAQPGQKNHGAIKLTQAGKGVDIMDGEHGFVQNGKFLTRTEAAKVFEEQTGKKPATPGELHSEDLAGAGLLKHLDKPWEKEAAAPPKDFTQVTPKAYDLATKVTTEDIPAMQSEAKKAAAETRAAHDRGDATDQGQKSQFFKEAIRMRQALDEATATGAKTDAELAKIANDHGVGVGEDDATKAKDLKAAIEKLPKGKEAIPGEKEKGQEKAGVLTGTEVSPFAQEYKEALTLQPHERTVRQNYVVEYVKRYQDISKQLEAAKAAGSSGDVESLTTMLTGIAKSLRSMKEGKFSFGSVGGQRGAYVQAMREGKPVNASAIDFWGMKLPEGYVKEEDKYVKQISTPPEDVNEPKPVSTVRPPAASVSSQQPIPSGPGAATAGTEIPETGAGGEKFGVAERVRAEREQAGQTAPTQPGEGISAPDSVDRGRQLLSSGTDPEKVMSDFEKTKRLSADDMAVARAHGEALAKAARDAESKFGTDSDEYAAAWQRLSNWDARTKPMQTEWHKTGQAQQGETDLDTGSFTGLQRSFKDATGKDFTPRQTGTAKGIAAKVRGVVKTATEATQKLFDELKKKSFGPRAEKDAEEQAAQAVANWHRENAVRLAAAERKATTAEAAKKTADEKAAQAEKDAATQAGTGRNRNAALEATKAETAKAVKAADDVLKAAKAERDELQKQRDKVTKFHRDAAAKAAAAERKRLDDPLFAVWEKAKAYIEQGVDNFDDLRNKVATDLGMKVDQVTRLMAQDNRIKRASDDVWKKQQAARQMKERAKQWVTDQAVPGYQRALARIPRLLFSLKVGFHGTVALGTHAPMVAFQPNFWKTYADNFGKMYRMVSPIGGKAYYERQVQDLFRKPNYIIARRAGLVNDPFQHEELRSQGILDKLSPTTSDWINKISGMGNRGYSVLKMLRQDMFDQQWNQLPKTSQIPEVAQAIADGVNHATGVVKATPFKGANLALFAPKLEMSRAAWLVADPVKAADTFARWKTASLGDKTFAINQVKEKAWVLGTYFGLLALNQGILAATGSKQKVNMTDPMKGDFMKFKAAGMTGSYGNAMLTMGRLPVRMLAIRESSGGKLKNLIYPDEDVYTVLGEYARSQQSPFASLVTDLWFQSDWMRRQLPGSNRPMPARLRKQGVKPYTWEEFWTEQVLPIPAEEAVREVWQKGLGMTDEQRAAGRKAWATLIIMSATGARLADDQDAKKVSFLTK